MKFLSAIVLTLTFFSISAHAIGNFNSVGVTSVYVREYQVDVIIAGSHGNPTGCRGPAYTLVINTNQFLNSKLMIAAVMAAQVSGKKISGWIGSCNNENVSVAHAISIDP